MTTPETSFILILCTPGNEWGCETISCQN